MARLDLVVLQSASTHDKEANLKSLRRLSSEIRSSPDIVVTPEYLMFDPTGLARDVVYRAAEDLEGQWSQELSRMAERLGACVLGHMFLRTSSGRVANAAVLYGKDGGDNGCVP